MTDAPKPIIQIQNVSKRFGKVTAVDNVSLDIMAGERRISRTDTALPDWYVSDAAYRPIPIAWFAGALILQVLLQPAIVYIGPEEIEKLGVLNRQILVSHTFAQYGAVAGSFNIIAILNRIAIFLAVVFKLHLPIKPSGNLKAAKIASVFHVDCLAQTVPRRLADKRHCLNFVGHSLLPFKSEKSSRQSRQVGV
jgi:hypothetical protein